MPSETAQLTAEPHTSEPWHASRSGRFIRKAIGSVTAYSIAEILFDDSNPVVGPGDSRRIVACVNALKGLNTPALESVAGADEETSLRLLAQVIAERVSELHGALSI